MKSLDELVKAGDEALRAGEWAAAEQHYRGALGSAEFGEALFGLGIARWWSGDTDEALRCWERAYAVFRQAVRAWAGCAERCTCVLRSA